jgi:hypothetical protein
MGLLDIKAIQEAAKKEIAKEASEQAIEKLKELYRKKEKAQLIVKNIDREIESYLCDVSVTLTFESAGVDTNK